MLAEEKAMLRAAQVGMVLNHLQTEIAGGRMRTGV